MPTWESQRHMSTQRRRHIINRMWLHGNFSYTCTYCGFTIQDTDKLWNEIECPTHADHYIDFFIDPTYYKKRCKRCGKIFSAPLTHTKRINQTRVANKIYCGIQKIFGCVYEVERIRQKAWKKGNQEYLHAYRIKNRAYNRDKMREYRRRDALKKLSQAQGLINRTFDPPSKNKK